MRTRPFPIGYALAREYLELRRSILGESNRTHHYREARGGMRAIASVSSSTGLVFPGSARFEDLASEIVGRHPIEPGPEWLATASEALFELLLDNLPERTDP